MKKRYIQLLFLILVVFALFFGGTVVSKPVHASGSSPVCDQIAKAIASDQSQIDRLSQQDPVPTQDIQALEDDIASLQARANENNCF